MSAPDLDMGEKLLAELAEKKSGHQENYVTQAALLRAQNALFKWAVNNLPALLATARRVAEMEALLKQPSPQMMKAGAQNVSFVTPVGAECVWKAMARELFDALALAPSEQRKEVG